MSGSVNKVILVGNLGRDPEIRRLNNGAPVAAFSLATTESWRDKATGEKRERTEWHDVVVFNEGLCKVAEQWLKKGMKVYVEGQLQTREWDDAQTGQKRRRTEVVLQAFGGTLVMLGDPRGGDRAPPPTENPRGADYGAVRSGAAPPPASSKLDDDIPF